MVVLWGDNKTEQNERRLWKKKTPTLEALLDTSTTRHTYTYGRRRRIPQNVLALAVQSARLPVLLDSASLGYRWRFEREVTRWWLRRWSSPRSNIWKIAHFKLYLKPPPTTLTKKKSTSTVERDWQVAWQLLTQNLDVQRRHFGIFERRLQLASTSRRVREATLLQVFFLLHPHLIILLL